MPATFSPDIDVLDEFTVEYSGTASSPNGITGVEIFDGETGDDLGSAAVAANGTWRFTDYLPGDLSRRGDAPVAVVTDGKGQTTSVAGNFQIAADSPSAPYLLQFKFGTGDQVTGNTINVFAPDGRVVVDVQADTSSGTLVSTETGHGPSVPFFAFGAGTAMIANYHLFGPGHDTLDLSQAQFSSFAQLLHHTSDANGSATIHAVNGALTITLDGVTKAQIAHHPGQFTLSTLS